MHNLALSYKRSRLCEAETQVVLTPAVMTTLTHSISTSDRNTAVPLNKIATK